MQNIVSAILKSRIEQQTTPIDLKKTHKRFSHHHRSERNGEDSSNECQIHTASSVRQIFNNSRRQQPSSPPLVVFSIALQFIFTCCFDSFQIHPFWYFLLFPPYYQIHKLIIYFSVFYDSLKKIDYPNACSLINLLLLSSVYLMYQLTWTRSSFRKKCPICCPALTLLLLHGYVR